MDAFHTLFIYEIQGTLCARRLWYATIETKATYGPRYGYASDLQSLDTDQLETKIDKEVQFLDMSERCSCQEKWKRYITSMKGWTRIDAVS